MKESDIVVVAASLSTRWKVHSVYRVAGVTPIAPEKVRIDLLCPYAYPYNKDTGLPIYADLTELGRELAVCEDGEGVRVILQVRV